MKPDAVITTTATSAPTTLWVGAEPALETSQPTKLMSVTTTTPSQNLRYAICFFALSSFDMNQTITSADDQPLLLRLAPNDALPISGPGAEGTVGRRRDADPKSDATGC